MEAEEILRLYENLEASKSPFNNLFQEVSDFILPSKPDVIQSNLPNRRKGAMLLDSTGVHACQLLASSMHGALTPTSLKWFGLKLRDDVINDQPEVRNWLEDCARRLDNALNSSNFSSEIHEVFLDLAGFGTAAVLQEELPKDEGGGFAGLHFETLPIGDYVFAEGRNGRVDTLLRRFTLSAGQAEARFASHPGFQGFGDKLQAALREHGPEGRQKRFSFIHAIQPRPKSHSGPRRLAYRMPLASIMVEVDEKKVIYESGYREFPVAVVRWSQTSGDDGWGRSPGMTALPDVKTLNEADKLALMALQKDLAPPLIAPNKGLIGGFSFSPNAINYYDNTKGKPEYLTSGVRWDVARLKSDERRERVRRIFYADQLMLQQGPQMTAAEVHVRFELMQRLLGPTLGRLIAELLNPILHRGFQLMLRAGGFPNPPLALQGMLERKGPPTLDVEYVGPLARAQKAQEVVAIERAYTLASSISRSRGGDPAIFDNLDDDKALRYGAEQAGLPGDILRGDSDRDSVRAQRMKQAQQMQAALAQQAAKG
ncbi:MAG: head-tail connector protein [Magnetococcales bacterium]|nr:head-tail connector protein [Magnetococcales bacterium]